MDDKIDHIIKLSGNQNRYQYFILFLTFFLWVNTCFMAVCIPFLEKPPMVTYTDVDGKMHHEAITYEICDEYKGKYVLDEEIHPSWVYDFGIYCDRVKIGLIGTFTFIGNGSGALFFPLITKIFTHKPNIIFSVVIFCITIISCTLLRYYWAILVLIIFTGTFGNFCCYSSIVLVEEVISSSKRSIFGSIINIGFSFSGVIYVALFYFLNNWLHVFYCLIGFSLLIWAMFFAFVYDSPREFIIRKNIDKTLQILRGIAKFNGKLDEFNEEIAKEENQAILNEIKDNRNEAYINVNPKDVEENKVNDCLNYDSGKSMPISGDISESLLKKEEITWVSLFKYASIRTKFIVLCICWLFSSGVYNGISIGAKFFPGNMYLNIIILYLMEAVSYFLCGFLINIPCLGRKKTLFILYLISICCMIVLFFAVGNEMLTFVFNLIARFCISGLYTLYYTYALENYPTSVRNIGFGINATFANIGGMIIPMVIEQVNERWMLVYYSGLLAICSILLMVFLKETVGLPMPETIEEMIIDNKIIEVSDKEKDS